MVSDDHAAHVRGQLVVLARGHALVLYEIFRHLYLSDIMVVGTHPCKQGVYTDRLCSGLDEIADDDAVMIGAGRCYHQGLHERLVEVEQFEEADIGRDLEDILKEREQQRDDRRDRHPGEDRKDDRGPCPCSEELSLCQKQYQHEDDVGYDDIQSAPQQRRPLLAADNAEGRGEAACEGIDRIKRVLQP